jgi:hypothetical protein
MGQSFMNDEVVNSAENKEAMGKLLKDLETAKADRIKIAVIKEGDEFEIKGLKFEVIDKFQDGKITARLIKGSSYSKLND